MSMTIVGRAWVVASALALSVILAAAPAASAAPAAEVWITLGQKEAAHLQGALTAAGRGDALRIVAEDGLVVARVHEHDIPMLSRIIHEDLRQCGGFVAHPSQEAALATVAREKALAPSSSLIVYTIDNGPVVTTLMAGIQELNIRNTITSLSAYFTRYHTSATAQDSAVWIRDQWAGYAQGRPDVTVELFAHPTATTPQPSVILTIQGTTLPTEVVVLGGHQDSINGASGQAPGADDDASGVASLSEVIRVAMVNGFRPQRTVKFMAYAAEEVGLRGSADIAAQHRAANVNVVGVLQLDMTNFKGSIGSDIVMITDRTDATQNTFVTDLVDTYLGLPRSNTTCGYGCSDHSSWFAQGYVASFPFEAMFGEHNGSIHTANDTLAQSGNNANHALKFSKLAAAYLAELAKGTFSTNVAPTANAGADQPGTTGATIGLSGSGNDPDSGPQPLTYAWSQVSGPAVTITNANQASASVVPPSAGTYVFDLRVSDGDLFDTDTMTLTVVDGGPPRTLSISDASLAEGNAGTANAVFTVSLNAASTAQVTVAYATADGSATVGALSTADVTNTGVITIVDNASGSPYPSTINVSSVTGVVTKVTVELKGFNHTYANDTDVLLVGPTGQTLMLASDFGGSSNVSGINLTLDDAAAATIPGSLVSGTYKPTDVADGSGNDVFGAPAPAAPYGTTLGAYNGLNPNGTWSLYVRDDFSGDVGSFAGGWALHITAQGQGDYSASSGTLTFSPGATSRTIPVSVNGDTAVEPSETFNVTLSGATIAAIADGTGVGTIGDDDGAPVPTMSIADTTVVEGNATVNAVFTVTLSSAASSAVTVTFATGTSGGAVAGTDYSATSGTLSFAVGQTVRTITVPVLGDTLDEATELFFVNLSGPVGATVVDGQGKGSLQDDDPEPALSISNPTITEPDSGIQGATFSVTLSPASGRSVTVDFATGAAGTATAGVDYTAKSGSLQFAPGATLKTLKVYANGDVDDEANEAFYVNLSNSVNATRADSQGAGTIVDNDPTPAGSPSLTIDDTSVTEGDTGSVTLTFTVTLSSASVGDVPVTFATGAGGTATSGVDYVARSGSVTFTPGQTSKTITVTVNGDVLNEADETMFLNLTSAGDASIADSQGRGTIVDNE